MINKENKKEFRSKKALKALYSSIQKNTYGVLAAASKSVRSFENAYQAVTSDVSCGIIKNFNDNLVLLGNVLDKEHYGFIKGISFKDKQYEDKFNYGQLIPLITECEKIIKLLEEEEKPKEITPQIKTKLGALREQLEDLQILDLGITKNIEISIEMFEKGNILCSALFASRVISYTLDQFKIDKELIEENENKNSKKSYIELISIDCINKGIIEKNEKKYQSSFLSNIKLARNLLTHELLFFPNEADSLSILSNSIKLLDLYKSHNELLVKTKNENNYKEKK